MNRTQKSLALPFAALAAGAFIAAAAPANAANADLDCEQGRTVACFLDNAASGEYWTVGGNHYAPGDGNNHILYSCPPGYVVHAYVTYINNLGVADSAAASATCLSYDP